MSTEQRNILIEQYLNSISEQVNRNYPQLIDSEKLKKAKEMFFQSLDDYEIIVKQIDNIVVEMIEDRKMILDNNQPRSSEELSQFTLALDTDKNGLYLSQQQIDLLIITELSSREELGNYFKNCSQFPNMSLNKVINNYDFIDLDSAKRILYNAYLDTLDSYTDEAVMTDIEKVTSKLTKMKIDKNEQEQILLSLKENGVNRTLQKLRTSKGDSFIIQFNRMVRDDFENVKSVGYDEMSSLSKLIDRDESIDTLIIATGKYDNIMASNGTEMYFDPYLTNKALQYCTKHNLHMRYHVLFDYSHIEKLMESGKTSADKEQILSDMKNYVQISMKYIEEHNKTLSDGKQLINVVEVFNELVEKNKTGKDKEQPYSMKWEKEFGITIKDLISCFDRIQKPNGVEFMYNETTLTESSKKREKVEAVLGQIEKNTPGFIGRFGDQAHLSEEDMQNNRIEIKETAKMLARIQNGEINVAKDLNGNSITQLIGSKKIEMTEHDFHFTKGFVEKLKENVSKGVIGHKDILTIKKNMQSKISTIYEKEGVKFECATYWSIFNNNDHNLVRENKKIIKDNKKNGTDNPLVENMYGGTLDNGKQINKINSLSQNHQKSSQIGHHQINIQQQSFAQRSNSEIQIASQIREKNKLIAQQKQMSKQQEKGKVLVKKATTSSSNNGYVNILSLSFIINLIASILLIFMYFVIKN